MGVMLVCNECSWVGLCADSDPCDYFTGDNEYDEWAYVCDLNERQAIYMEVVLEYD